MDSTILCAGMATEGLSSDNGFSLSQPNDHRNSRFRGVVLLNSGNWGARISTQYQVVWLGTFQMEEEAAKAYDTAALKLHKGDSFLNFPWSDHTPQELIFQSFYSTGEIFRMIKDKSYSSNLATFIADHMVNHANHHMGEQGISSQLLFRKVLAPRDVAKHPRLLIPKEYALRYFPPVTGDVESVQIVFYDKDGVPWTFRYSCWESNQSFVFTTGWKQFVNAKGLQRGETISFYRCEYEEEIEESPFFIIDINRGNNSENAAIGGNMGMEIHVGRNSDNGMGVNEIHVGRNSDSRMDVDDKEKEPAEKEIMLFGVRIGCEQHQPQSSS